MDDAMHLAATEPADRIAAEPGFVDYQAITTGDGTITSTTIFDDEDPVPGLQRRGRRVRPRRRALLGYLDDAGTRPTELARLLNQHKQYVGRLIDELETLGYVQRRPDPRDRRSKLIVPTERGRDEQQQADLILGEIEDRHAARIGADRYADFRRLLRALVVSSEGCASDPDGR